MWRGVSLHKTGVCGTAVRYVRLVVMITAGTDIRLVARRHVDLGRTRSMMCMHTRAA